MEKTQSFQELHSGYRYIAYIFYLLLTTTLKVNASLSHEGIKSGSSAEKCVHTVSHLRKLRSPKTPHKQ